MKKKFILGGLAMLSVLAFAQTSSSTNQETESIFWGRKCKPVQHVGDGEVADLMSGSKCCYYILWIPTNCQNQDEG